MTEINYFNFFILSGGDMMMTRQILILIHLYNYYRRAA
jgi:hypothetical protein